MGKCPPSERFCKGEIRPSAGNAVMVVVVVVVDSLTG